MTSCAATGNAAHIAALAPERFALKVLEAADCAALGMGCFLGVSAASDEPPKMIHLTYTPKTPSGKKVRRLQRCDA